MKVMQEQEENEKVTWPRDSLFRYFELLEMLQHNLDERKRLQNLAGKESHGGGGVVVVVVVPSRTVFRWRRD